MNIKEWVTRYDASTINDIPATADHMSSMERMYMWAYPEPDYSSWDDGSMMTMADWFIVTSVRGTFRTYDTDIYMGGDKYHYMDNE